jgi:hypothetical protein
MGDMTNAIATRPAEGRGAFHLVQLLPAPVTIAALVIAGSHHLETAPLGVIAVIGILATVCSVLLPAITSAPHSSKMPVPREEDRIS